MKQKFKIVRAAVATQSNESKNELYLNYIKALVRSENLQNNLEKTCSMLINSPSSIINKQAEKLNNSLNNLLVQVMLYQNTIDFVSRNGR